MLLSEMAKRHVSGYSMTLFQSLATAAGYDPVQGPGSSCTGDGSSGQCVLPWGNGTKAVSSIVLVATGVSFAVRTSEANPLRCTQRTDHRLWLPCSLRLALRQTMAPLDAGYSSLLQLFAGQRSSLVCL